MSKPKIFIGSSTNGLGVARAVQANLQDFAEPTVWDQDVYEMQRTNINNLINALHEYDFAIFVFLPDDLTKQRDVEGRTVRDNVIYEAGLFAGHLGFERVFFLKPHGVQDLLLPTDLLAVEVVTYDSTRSDNNLRAATGPFCMKVSEVILSKTKQEKAATTVVINNGKLHCDMNAALADLRKRIEEGMIKVLRGDIIQHSSERAFELVSALASHGASLNLYLQHPATLKMLCSDYRSKIEQRLRRYRSELRFIKYEGPLEVYLYNSPATLSGIRIMLENDTTLFLLSWYTYLSDELPTDLLTYQINGSENPCIEIASSHQDEYSHLEDYFNKMLENYRLQSNKEPLYALPRDKNLSSKDWQEKVSKMLQEVRT